MRHQIRNQATATEVPQGNASVGVANDGHQIKKFVEQFLKLKLLKFSGGEDLETAISWIEELEKTFALLRCSEEDKVTLAVYQL